MRNSRHLALLLLLRAGARPAAAGTTVLHLAAHKGHRAIVDDIATIYPNPDAWFTLLTGGYTARKAAITLPPAQRSFLQKLYEDDEKVLLRHIHSFLHKPRYLADLDTRDSDGRTAAQVAQSNGHEAIVTLLQDSGATV